jgi:hypothetical protein
LGSGGRKYAFQVNDGPGGIRGDYRGAEILQIPLAEDSRDFGFVELDLALSDGLAGEPEASKSDKG